DVAGLLTGTSTGIRIAGVAQWESRSLPSLRRGFDSLHPLQRVRFDGCRNEYRPCGSVVEHSLGKGEVMRSIRIMGTTKFLDHSTVRSQPWQKASLNGPNRT